jgi:hypothetical protein
MSVDLSQKAIQQYLEYIAYEKYKSVNYECAEIILSLCLNDLYLKGRLVKGALFRRFGQFEEGLKVLMDIEKTLSTQVNK